MEARRHRLLIVSNRLPVTIHDAGGRFAFEPSSGGLATGVRSAHDPARGLWFGWPGSGLELNRGRRQRLDAQLAEQGLAAVHLASQEVRQYYDGFSNGVLWPLFHYLLDRMPLAARDWPAYCRANERFADAVAASYEEGDAIWVHDYHLMLVPGLLRRRLPDAPIAFFLHVPFPSSELFRILPSRRELLEGLLGADLIGFHTHAYVRHFVVALRFIAGVDPSGDTLKRDGRLVRIGCFPMGIDGSRFRERSQHPPVVDEAARLREEAGGRKILLAVDRLDYTKGIPRRLAAFERFLERHPDAAGQVRLVQLAVPSRGENESYRSFRREVEEMVGRINGRFGSLNAMPIHYLVRSVGDDTLVAMYKAADVMLVTPVRDGMNLVAKEFVACRVDDDGVLVLSEFAGAAEELREAILVNPFDADGTADAIARALALEPADARARMRSMRARVLRHDVHHWTRSVLTALDDTVAARNTESAARTSVEALSARIERAGRDHPVALLVDYDGTLVPFSALPALAAPDEELMGLLESVGRVPRLSLHLVSGRPRADIEGWFGRLPITLWAEHGLWGRAAGDGDWVMTIVPALEWMADAEAIMERACAETPGSFIERKTASLAWHYRMADFEFGAAQARRLEGELREHLAGAPVSVLSGHRVLEARAAGVNKGLVVQRVVLGADRGPVVVAVGDDATDEDMFAAVPESGLTVRVGPGATHARTRLDDWRAVRALLARVATAFGPAPGAGPSTEGD